MYYELAGAGTPLVLISPLGADHLNWAMQVPALTAAGFRCLTFDNRDVGQTGPSAGAVVIRDCAADTAALMREVGMPRAHVVGASFGGMIAQELALTCPDQVATLTLVCTATHQEELSAAVFRSWKTMQAALTPAAFFQAISPWLFSYRFLQETEPMATVLGLVGGNPFPQSAAGFGRQVDAILAHDTRDRVATLRLPTHVIVGREDVLTPPRLSRAMAAAIPGATLTEVPDVAHALNSENPPALSQAVIAFLDRHR
jgi:pimeloyl-ACP methyl ester carboxylesterase